MLFHQQHPTFSIHPIYTRITELAGHVPTHLTPDGSCSSIVYFMGAVGPQFNGLLYNEVLGITNDIPAAPSMYQDLLIVNISVPWPFVISGFHSTTIGPLVMIN